MALTRRNLFLTTGSMIALASTVRGSLAQSYDAPAAAPAATGPFAVPALGYDFAALEPHIDAMTMHLHHDKHHAGYVTNLNTAAKTAPEIASQPIEVVLASLDTLPESVRKTVRNNMGGHANHSMFWEVMGPPRGIGPEGALLSAIDRDLGGVEAMQTAFNGAGGKVFGSGWVFVTVTPEGRLAIETRPNQDTPLMEGGRVLFGNDVWEHSYYLTYQNRRADYLKAWWNVLDWSKVADRYARAQRGALAI